MDILKKTFEGVSAATIVRTVCLMLALVNQILSATGHAVIPIENAEVEQLVTSMITVATALVSWWKNNSFTTVAIEADKVFDRLKKNGV